MSGQTDRRSQVDLGASSSWRPVTPTRGPGRVGPHPKRGQGELGRGGRHEHPYRLAGYDAGVVRVALDGVLETRMAQLPGRGADRRCHRRCRWRESSGEHRDSCRAAASQGHSQHHRAQNPDHARRRSLPPSSAPHPHDCDPPHRPVPSTRRRPRYRSASAMIAGQREWTSTYAAMIEWMTASLTASSSRLDAVRTLQTAVGSRRAARIVQIQVHPRSCNSEVQRSTPWLSRPLPWANRYEHLSRAPFFGIVWSRSDG